MNGSDRTVNVAGVPRRCVAVLLSGLLLAAAQAAVGIAATADASRLPHPWPRALALPRGGRLVPQPGIDSELHGISCTSSANCWAVGDYVPSGGDTLATLNLAVHWNGAAWSLVTTPDPGGFDARDFNDLVAVRCTSGVSCWAVGEAGSLNASIAAEALHWDGGNWSAG